MHENFIELYTDQIRNDFKHSGEKIRKWYLQIEQHLKNGDYFYDQQKAKEAVIFIENFCRHHEGELAPQKIKLELWQKAFVSVLFGCVDKDGNRQFREIVLIIGRKNGKTLLAAAIAAYCAFLDNEYGGRIYFVAPKLEQAGFCFEAFCQMIYKEPFLEKQVRKRRTDIYIEQSNTTAKPLAFNAKKADGLNVSLCVADEVASWQGEAGMKFYEVIKSSVGSRRQPILLSITTAGYVDDGIFDTLMSRCTAVLNGTSEETRLAPFIYEIDDIEKWDDMDELHKANPNLGVSVTEQYMRDEIAIAHGSLSKRAEFIVKYCNKKQNSSTAWFNVQDIEKNFSNTPLHLEDFKNCYGVLGIDLSRTTDLSAVTLLIQKGAKIYGFAKFFMPRERIKDATAEENVPYEMYVKRGFLELSGDNFIDYHDCEKWVKELISKYKIYPLKVGYDRYSAQYLVQDLAAAGLHMDDVYQGENLSPVIKETEGLVKDATYEFGDNDLLKMHFYNSALKANAESGRVKLIKNNPRVHIDGVAALLDAMCVRQKYYGEIGTRLENKGR